jgi:hypothetical protein
MRAALTNQRHTAIVAAAVLINTLSARAQSALASADMSLSANASPYTIVSRSAHSRTWQRVEWENGMGGQQIPHIHRYIEITTGMAHLVGDQWVDSSPEIQVTATGAQALNAQHSVTFLGSINASGAVQITTPDGKRLVSNILGLRYFDTSTSASAIIAQIKDSNGQLLPSKDRALFPDAFSGVQADVLYVNSISGFEQFVVLKEKTPSPAQWNLNAASVLLQVITEFLDPPSPQVTTVEDADGPDQHIDHGIMKMNRGYAFMIGSEEHKIPVRKQWVVQDGRTLLIESVRLRDLAPLLSQLPDPGTASLSTPPDRTRQLAGRGALFPPSPTARPTDALALAKVSPPDTGLALDYSLLTSQTNFFAGCSDTILVNGNVSLSGSNVFEGGAVLKFATNSSITFQAGAPATSATFLGSAYRPILCTAKDDNSAGESIGTGNPIGFYANPALSFVSFSPVLIANVRIAYAAQAISAHVGSSIILSNCQFLQCQNGLHLDNASGFVRNALFAGVATNFNGVAYGSLDVQNVTFATSSRLASSGDSLVAWSLAFTNCIFANVTNMPGSELTLSGGDNGFYNTAPTFGNDPISASTWPFQAAGVASYYLADGCPFTGVGTTNIAPGLIANLRTRTTQPPIVFTNITFTNDTTFTPQAQRETGQIDLGWAADPLDFVFGGCTANANLTFSAGTAVGWFRTSQGWNHAGHGIHIGDSKTVSFNGTATAPCYWVRRTTVQEGIPGFVEPGYGPGGITGWTPASQPFSLAPVLSMRFTKCSVLAWEAMHMRDDNGYLIVHARDCEFWAGSLGGYCSQLNYTNCVFDRLSTWTAWNGVPSTNCTFIQQNCLVRGGILNLGRSAPDSYGHYPLWSVHDTAFDATSLLVSDAAGSNPNWTAFNYNAFLTGAHTNLPTGANDLPVATFNWQKSWLGGFYLASDSSLKDSGSVSDAALLGFYNFTTQTNQQKELNSQVDRSYHYVACDTNGVPVSTPGDSIPDYLADLNGNGLVDPGEISWTNYYSPNGLTNGPGLQVFTPLRNPVP